jgi:hypothetical protein
VLKGKTTRQIKTERKREAKEKYRGTVKERAEAAGIRSCVE